MEEKLDGMERWTMKLWLQLKFTAIGEEQKWYRRQMEDEGSWGKFVYWIEKKFELNESFIF